MNADTVLTYLARPVHAVAQRLNRVRCSFCGRDREQVVAMVSGPGVYICDRCVHDAAGVIEASRRTSDDSE